MKRWTLAFAALLVACSQHTLELTPRLGDGGTAEDAAPSLPDAEAREDAGLTLDDGGAVSCGNHVCACSDRRDDDGDGLTDGFDPECSAAFDDDEASFGVGQHGDNPNAKRRDCFFDGNSGLDDGCDVLGSCLDTGARDDASCGQCCAGAECRATCLPRAPNGCDCFGCCSVTGPSGTLTVRLEDSCSLATLDIDSACPRCELNLTCFNPCGECELCVGRPESALPASCAARGGFECEGGQRCSEDAACAAGSFCELGCCVPPLL